MKDLCFDCMGAGIVEFDYGEESEFAECFRCAGTGFEIKGEKYYLLRDGTKAAIFTEPSKSHRIGDVVFRLKEALKMKHPHRFEITVILIFALTILLVVSCGVYPWSGS